MLLYSTRLRVNEKFTPEVFVDNLIEWNQSGRYIIDEIERGMLSFIVGDDDNYLDVIHLENKKIIASRMHTETNGGIWNIDFILNYADNILSVHVNRSFSENTLNTKSRAYMPTFICQIIKNGYAGTSNGLDISDKALNVTDHDVILNAVDSYEDEYALPVVYLSAKSRLTADKLASKLTGIAVVVSDDSNSIMEKYPDPIIVFFPHKSMSSVRFGEYPFHRDIEFAVTEYHNNREYNDLETWNGVQSQCINSSNAELLGKYREISTDNDALTEMYDELEQKLGEEAKLRDALGSENSRLIAENARLMQELKRLRTNGTPVIMHGEENDMYPDEQREIIMDILSDYLRKGVEENTRRHDVISSVIDANPVNGTPEIYKNIIKNALDGYKTFSAAKITNALKETGIEIIEHTGHYKIAFKGDHRYVCEAAATCSDCRGGKNLISEINKIMF